jgi:hypothetical protein
VGPGAGAGEHVRELNGGRMGTTERVPGPLRFELEHAHLAIALALDADLGAHLERVALVSKFPPARHRCASGERRRSRAPADTGAWRQHLSQGVTPPGGHRG